MPSSLPSTATYYMSWSGLDSRFPLTGTVAGAEAKRTPSILAPSGHSEEITKVTALPGLTTGYTRKLWQILKMETTSVPSENRTANALTEMTSQLRVGLPDGAV